MTALTEALSAIVGAAHVVTDPDIVATRCVDYTGRYRGAAAVLVRPGTAARWRRCSAPAATPAAV